MSYKLLQSYILHPNIAEELDTEFLDGVANDVVDGYDLDKESRQGWEENIDKYIELATQIVEEKSFPWPGAANVKYPLLTTAALNFGARAYPALIPGYDLVKGRIIGSYTEEKEEKSIRVGQHMSYQLLEEMPEWEEDMDKLLHILPIVGCAFKKTYRNELEGVNYSELILPDDLVVNYWAKSLDTAWRKTHVLELTQNEIIERINEGTYLDIELQEPSTTDASTRNETTDKVQNLRVQSNSDMSTPYIILEQHTFLDLDEDGYYEPYVVTVDKESRQVLRIVARYDENSIKAIQDLDKVIRIKPIEYFTKYSFIPNPDGGFYDLGYGLYLHGINETVNTAINQLLDSGTMYNTNGGFVGRGVRIKGGNQSFRPNEWKQTNSSGNDLKNNIVPLPTREPSGAMFNLLVYMVDAGQRMSSSGDMMMGENPGQNQKASTTMAVLDQGMKVFHSIYKRLHRALKKELQKLFYLNSRYLTSEHYFTILDPLSAESAAISANDYDISTLDIVPAADPSISTEQQRLIKAQGLLELHGMLGLNTAEVRKRVLQAQNHAGIDKLLEPNPQQPPPPEIIFQQTELQHKIAEDNRRYNLDVYRTKVEGMTKIASAIEAIAKAEAQEKGQQIDTYIKVLEQLRVEQSELNEQAQTLMMGENEEEEPEEETENENESENNQE